MAVPLEGGKGRAIQEKSFFFPTVRVSTAIKLEGGGRRGVNALIALPLKKKCGFPYSIQKLWRGE